LARSDGPAWVCRRAGFPSAVRLCSGCELTLGYGPARPRRGIEHAEAGARRRAVLRMHEMDRAKIALCATTCPPSSVHRRCPKLLSLVLCRREPRKRAVRSALVVVLEPFVDDLARVLESVEPVRVQTLIS